MAFGLEKCRILNNNGAQHAEKNTKGEKGEDESIGEDMELEEMKVHEFYRYYGH